MVLLVSTFFIGLGALVDRAGATLKSDAKALELIRLARVAIGGDANINNVRSMTIAGNSTHFFDKKAFSKPSKALWKSICSCRISSAKWSESEILITIPKMCNKNELKSSSRKMATEMF